MNYAIQQVFRDEVSKRLFANPDFIKKIMEIDSEEIERKKKYEHRKKVIKKLLSE